MELYEKLLQRIENDEPIYCNKTFAKDLESIANEHHQEQVNIILGDVSSCYALFNEEDNIQELYQSEVNAKEALRERQHIVPLTEYYIDLIQID
jgi:hypothetical protein